MQIASLEDRTMYSLATEFTEGLYIKFLECKNFICKYKYSVDCKTKITGQL